MADMPITDTNILGVSFKRGLSKNLPTSSKNIKDGTFYLTTDTHRLYIGQKTGSETNLVELNKSITIVKALSDLPLHGETGVNDLLKDYVGQFYYVQTLNILCVVIKEEKEGKDPVYKWQQINPDTTLASSLDNTAVAVSDNTATITSTVADSKGNSSKGIHKVKGGTNITITQDPNEDGYTISSTNTNTTYSLGTNTTSKETDPPSEEKDLTTKIILTSSNNNKDEIQITTSDDAYSELKATANDGTIDFNLKVNNMYNTGFSSGYGDSNTGFKFEVTDGAGSKPASIDPIIKYGSGTTTDVHFNSGIATLDVYTKEQTDTAIKSALQTADAMTFKGVLDLKREGTEEPPVYKVILQGAEPETVITSANKGDTYKVGKEGTYFGHLCKIGDLLIAKEDGLNSSTISSKDKWYYIPSGDDEIINTAVSGNDTFQITSSARNVIGAHTLKTPDSQTGDVVINRVGSEQTELIQTIDHKTYSSPANNTPSDQTPISSTLNTETSFTAITGIQTSNGHVTGYTTQTLNNNVKYSINSVNHKASVSNNNQSLSIGPVITDTNGGTIPLTRLNIQTETLKFTAQNANNVNINLVWGEF